jgi:hypothetical protein
MGVAILVVAVVWLYCSYLLTFHRKMFLVAGAWLRVVMLGILYLLIARVMLDAELSEYLIPASFFGLLLSLLHGRRFSIATMTALTALVSLIPGADPVRQLILFSGSVIAALGSVPIASRWKLIATGLMVCVCHCCVLAALWLAGGMQTRVVPADQFLTEMAWAGAAGFAYAGILANALLPLIEYLFGVTTQMTLLEISSQNHPLLKRLIMEAPGTYHHSLIVGNLAEAAAEAVGADWLLARVGAYYHDVGKIEKPLYFAENANNMPDRHKNLSPAMSTLIITAHTKDGVQIARSFNLPVEIVNFIEQHHGDSVVEYFYQHAVARAEPGEKPSPEAFRYPGPKPRTKEVGIVLLADAAEAVTRSVSDPTPARIESVVSDVIEKRVSDGQLDECPLTLKDLRAVRESFVRVLVGMYHSRVKYPSADRVGHEH